ncbi:MAG: DUF4157 domain-containing protein [Acidobacteriota bacterium]|nr:DUF4157 domain-containing protein [Acidobacteriota bacterium]
MTRDRAGQRAPTVVERRPSVAVARSGAAAAAPSAARALQHRLGNQSIQRFAAQVVARASAPDGQPNGAAPSGTLSLSRPGDAHEREADRVASVVMRDSGRDATSISRSGPAVQRVCGDCEEEISNHHGGDEPRAASDATTVHRSAGTNDAGHVSPSVAQSIHSMHGGGAPLPAPTRALFESRFGAAFGRVRVHTDAHAARTASDINARAFTVGHDIAFAPGHYAPHSDQGQRLLAHELAHVVQQGGTTARIVQRDDAPGDQPEGVEPAATPLFVPEGVVLELLHLLELEDVTGAAEGAGAEPAEPAEPAKPAEDYSEAEAKFQEDLDNATAWVGYGASADRKIILLRTEDLRLQNDAAYKESVIAKFATRNDPNGEYLEWLMDTYNASSKTEEGTLSRMNANVPGLALTDANFVDNAIIQRWDGGNAFPTYAWNIISPLVSPPGSIRASAPSNRRETQAAYVNSWGSLDFDLSENGIPASYSRSLSITEYFTVKERSVSKLLTMPDGTWIYEHFVLPEETQLHSAAMKSYTAHLTSYVLAALQQSVLDKWAAATAFRWNAFDAYAISAFRGTHPSGLGSVEDFYNYAPKGLALGSGLMAAKVKAQLQTTGVNPYLFLSKVSDDVQKLGPGLINQLNASELQTFKNILVSADSKIVKLAPSLRLMTAVEWSIRKGFAAQNIVALLENLDAILWDILKEYAKDKAVKKAIMTGIGYFGPWGRAISLVYNVLDFFDDARDKLELALLLKSFVEALDEAKNSESVVKTQQVSAKLAQVYETTFQRLIQKLGAKLVSKLSAVGARKLKEKRRRGEKMGEAERTNLLEEAKDERDAKKLKPDSVEAEFQTAIKSPIKVVGGAIEIELPNGHRWRRERGAKGWCRASNDCVGDFLNPEITNELDSYARKNLPRDVNYDDYPSILVDEPRLHQTTKGNFGEVVSDHMMSKHYDNLGGITHLENPDRGPGIDNVWKPRNSRHFDYSVSETKFVQGFDGDLHRVKMGKTRSGPQLSDSWITGKDYNTMKQRLEEVVGEEMARKMRASVENNRVERLLIVVNETGQTWTYEVDSGGKAYRLKTD